MIADFPILKSYNTAGLLLFQFIHVNAVSAYPGVFDSKIIAPLSLKAGFNWYKGYSTPQTLHFDEVQENSVHGKFYKQTISGFAPGDKEALIQLMEGMDNNYFIVQVRDTAKQNRLVGGYSYPMLFSSTYNSGSARADSKGYEFSFYSESPFRAPIYL